MTTPLRKAQGSRMHLDGTTLRDIWAVHMTSDGLVSVYTAAPDLTRGD